MDHSSTDANMTDKETDVSTKTVDENVTEQQADISTQTTYVSSAPLRKYL